MNHTDEYCIFRRDDLTGVYVGRHKHLSITSSGNQYSSLLLRGGTGTAEEIQRLPTSTGVRCECTSGSPNANIEPRHRLLDERRGLPVYQREVTASQYVHKGGTPHYPFQHQQKNQQHQLPELSKKPEPRLADAPQYSFPWIPGWAVPGKDSGINDSSVAVFRKSPLCWLGKC